MCIIWVSLNLLKFNVQVRNAHDHKQQDRNGQMEDENIEQTKKGRQVTSWSEPSLTTDERNFSRRTLTCNYVCRRKYPAIYSDDQISWHNCCRHYSVKLLRAWKCSMSHKTWTWTSWASVSDSPVRRRRVPRAIHPNTCQVKRAWYLASYATALCQGRETLFVSWRNQSRGWGKIRL